MKPWTITCTFFCPLWLGIECLARTASTADLNALKAELEALRTDYEKRIQALEMQIQQLQSQSSQTPPAPTPALPPAAAAPTQPPAAQAQVPKDAPRAGGPGGALPVYSIATAASKVFNPDIAVIGDFIDVSGSNHVNLARAPQMHESEVVAFQAIVDPSRADSSFSYSEVVTPKKANEAYRQVPRFFEESLFVV